MVTGQEFKFKFAQRIVKRAFIMTIICYSSVNKKIIVLNFILGSNSLIEAISSDEDASSTEEQLLADEAFIGLIEPAVKKIGGGGAVSLSAFQVRGHPETM